MDLSIVILAAGQGTRMRSRLPKVLQPLAGRPLLGHVLDCAHELDCEDIAVVYGHGGDAVPHAFEGMNLKWALQAEQLGTGHAVKVAMPQIDDDRLVLVLCGDVPLLQAATLRNLTAACADGALGVLTVDMPDPTGYGRILRNSDGHVTRIVEQKDATAEELAVSEINTGVICCPASLLKPALESLKADNAQAEYYLTDVIAMTANDGHAVLGVKADNPDEVMGINNRAHLAQAERAYQVRQANLLLDAGVTLADPARTDVRGTLACGQDVFIDINTVFEGNVSIGDGARIGPGSVIRNSHIGADTEIHPHCVIEDSSVGAKCQIGPFARLRPGADFRDGSKAGNFVEVKKSVIGKGSKVNHLTYIGDAEVGENANIGAGTITCNYDGANKHKTIIGDDAFIGSGVNLVAPIEIGPGATIGAGSTITREAPPNGLTLTRSPQKSLPDWKRPTKKT